MLWLSGPVCILLFISLPETSSSNILLHRARRLRTALGNNNLKSQSEIDQANLTFSQVANDALIKPWQINALDPAVLFSTLYTALVYAIFYSFFESFPLVYPVIYGFNLGESSLPFLAVLIGLPIAAGSYCAHWYFFVERRIQVKGIGEPEDRLIPALFASFLIPIGLFLFGELSLSL
jgi:DHA1 family multidrug resistance protein-like MFS transporter